MIRGAVLHLHNEQPLMADLFELPSAADVGLRCTNLRDMNGKRPVFVDDPNSIFFFPYIHMRFVEISPRAIAESDVDLPMPVPVGVAVPAVAPEVAPVEDDAELEIDEDFLRRIREV